MAPAHQVDGKHVHVLQETSDPDATKMGHILVTEDPVWKSSIGETKQTFLIKRERIGPWKAFARLTQKPLGSIHNIF